MSVDGWIGNSNLVPYHRQEKLCCTHIIPLKLTLVQLVLFFFGCAIQLAGILAPRPGVEPVPPAVEARSPNHWAAKEFPAGTFIISIL